MNEEDERLLARLRAGDEDAHREFVDRYKDRVLAVVSRIAGRGGEADDLAQEAFFKAFDKLDRFQRKSSLFTWLYRIAANTAMDHVKSRRRHAAISLDGLPPGLGDPADHGEHPGARLERDELVARVRRAVEELPEPFRTTLVLRELEGHSYQDVAEILGVSIGTVESRIFRARRKLRAILERVNDHAET